MDDLRLELLYCRNLLDSAMRRLAEMVQEGASVRFDAAEDSDGTPRGAD